MVAPAPDAAGPPRLVQEHRHGIGCSFLHDYQRLGLQRLLGEPRLDSLLHFLRRPPGRWYAPGVRDTDRTISLNPLVGYYRRISPGCRLGNPDRRQLSRRVVTPTLTLRAARRT